MNICLSFDDGRIDQYENAFLILKKYGLKATFHITTGFIDGSFECECFGKDRKPIGIDQLTEMNNCGMEISSHGDKHTMDKDDFFLSTKKIETWGIKKKKYGFSLPNSDFKSCSFDAFIKDNPKLLYVRVGRNQKCYTLINKIRYLLYNCFGFYGCYERFNKNNLIDAFEQFRIHSLVVRQKTKAKDLVKFIEKNKKTNQTLIIMFHSIVKTPQNKWEWSIDSFDYLCSYFCKNNLFLNVNTIETMVQSIY